MVIPMVESKNHLQQRQGLVGISWVLVPSSRYCNRGLRFFGWKSLRLNMQESWWLLLGRGKNPRYIPLFTGCENISVLQDFCPSVAELIFCSKAMRTVSFSSGNALEQCRAEFLGRNPENFSVRLPSKLPIIPKTAWQLKTKLKTEDVDMCGIICFSLVFHPYWTSIIWSSSPSANCSISNKKESWTAVQVVTVARPCFARYLYVILLLGSINAHPLPVTVNTRTE